jgi:hypothetical protein
MCSATSLTISQTCQAASVTNYQPRLHDVPEEQRSRLHRGEYVKSPTWQEDCYLLPVGKSIAYRSRIFDVAVIRKVVFLATRLVGDPWLRAQCRSQIVDVGTDWCAILKRHCS